MNGALFAFIADHAFEIASLFVSAAALVYAALALKTARQAIEISKDSDVAALRLRANDEMSAAERSFHKFQELCGLTRNDWARHIDSHYPILGRDFGQPKETVHIVELERKGYALLQELKDATPSASTNNAAEFEDYIKRAQGIAIRIERLAIDLKPPKPLNR